MTARKLCSPSELANRKRRPPLRLHFQKHGFSRDPSVTLCCHSFRAVWRVVRRPPIILFARWRRQITPRDWPSQVCVLLRAACLVWGQCVIIYSYCIYAFFNLQLQENDNYNKNSESKMWPQQIWPHPQRTCHTGPDLLFYLEEMLKCNYLLAVDFNGLQLEETSGRGITSAGECSSISRFIFRVTALGGRARRATVIVP